MRDASEPQVVRFGVFEVDLDARELRKKGAKVRLQEQPLQVLALLVGRPGELVTREELKQTLWPGTVVDFDHGLNTIVNKLREALGDSADSPRFIETLPRRGYRFIYPVERAPGAAGRGAPGEAAELRQPAVPRRPRWALRAFLTAVPAVMLGILVLERDALRDARSGRPQAVAVRSIAVLPLKNLSADPRHDYFVDAMTEALITELGKIGSLRVLSYQSVLGYRETTRPLPQLATELGVDAFLQGAVLHAGQKVRVTASLVQPSPERHLWAETYEFDLRDVVAVQGEVARDVASRIRVKVTPAEQVRLTHSRRVDPEAYAAYLLGRAHLSKTPTQASWARSKEYLEKAVERDPSYAPAHAALAELHIRHRGLTRDHREARAEARRWAESALQLDDTLAEAHAVLARCAQQDWDWARAEREYRRAIDLNPSYALARIWYAMYLYAMLRVEEAANEAKLAQQLDPVSTLVNTWAGAAYLLADRPDEAVASWQRALELDPGYADASLALARTRIVQGRHEQAIAELRRALTFNERQPYLLGALAHAYAKAGDRHEALKAVSDLDRIQGDDSGSTPFGAIWAYAGLGDKERAFERLERAYRERVGRLVWLNVDPLLEPLRSDPRFDDLVRRVGLPARRSPPPR